MIAGIGTDIIDVQRIRRLLERYGDRLVERILHPDEKGQKIDARLVAKRFAVKEAVAKALGTGIRWPVTWQQMWIDHDQQGRPFLQVEPALKDWLEARSWQVHISLSDEKNQVVAMAIAEKISSIK